jgi:hypothetical protein
MTNPGLYADLYQQMRELADLVDNVLIGLKDSPTIGKAEREKLAQTLSSLSEENPDNLSDRLLGVILTSGQSDNRQKWKNLSSSLAMDSTDKQLLEDLEQFAQLLEQRQSVALAKMRGWTR